MMLNGGKLKRAPEQNSFFWWHLKIEKSNFIMGYRTIGYQDITVFFCSTPGQAGKKRLV